MRSLFGQSVLEDDSEWMSVSDLMAGLMVIFLFVAVVFIRSYEKQAGELEEELRFSMPASTAPVSSYAGPFELSGEKVWPVLSFAHGRFSAWGDRGWAEAEPTSFLPISEEAQDLQTALEAARRDVKRYAQRVQEERERTAFYSKRYMEQREMVQENAEIRNISQAWLDTEAAIYQALLSEFASDLPRWNAEINEETLNIRFRSPDVLFESGRADLRPEFGEILQDFFPRYVAVIDHFRGSIDEVRIEGHTSSTWNQGTSPDDAYFLNMDLSQERTRAVLKSAMSLPEVTPSRAWLQPLVTANGLSSSRPILKADGSEDVERSRRVEFRIRTTARSDIMRVLEGEP